MLDTNHPHHHLTVATGPSSSDPFPSPDHGLSSKRKRRPAGTPDPDAEVVSLSPKTLLESDRYVCEICNQGFQRDQNLQMHRRRHKVPWKLLKRDSPEVKKRVFVCPEPSCLHHDPCHALGDLVGIKKHFRRKHSNNKQWVCEKCSKGYAVQSDYKAHLKTCGTRGHSCDCGRVFSRVESFIEHQDACVVRHVHPDLPAFRRTCSPPTASSNSLSSETNFNATRAFPRIQQIQPHPELLHLQAQEDTHNNLELQLLPPSSSSLFEENNNNQTHLKLSIGSRISFRNEEEKLKMAMAEMAFAEESRQKAKRQIEMAELEFAKAKRIRQQAQVELERAKLQQEQVTKKVNSAILEITCHCCKQRFQAVSNKASTTTADETSSIGLSYMSSAVTEAEGD
ncbi:protein SHOOT GRAVITROPISM 5-like [Cynara cardunculus var. scolymus]|uniref:Zinc finger, C2H2 n=1 Tax=Cynara cardunculus var. scolymus TaxID=59895 RepID=A0A118JXN2_CYNCS|nr:protein SHOOT GRAVITROPISM 5-like [Cynara cardunculus var. scolymus]KVH96387.1 Zinc finger, C2H2 [Cynara cardunculus var. scolymus]